MVVANEDLWNRPPSARLHHFLAPGRLEIDPDLLQSTDPLVLQQLLGKLTGTAPAKLPAPDDAEA